MEAKQPQVTERDRDYFRRLGEWKREGHAIARAEHLALGPRERLLRAISFAMRERANVRAEEPDSSVSFYERADRLGLRCR